MNGQLMTQQRGYSSLTVKAIDEDQRIIRGWATVPEADRVGDIVDPMGASFPEVVPLLWLHRHDEPVGTVKFGKPTRKGVPFEAKLPTIVAPSQLKARIDEAWESVKNGLVRWVSIGFRSLESSVIPSTGGLLFKKTEFYELSLVTVPANAGATIDEIKSLDKQILAASGIKGIAKTQAKPSGVSEKTITVKTTKIKHKVNDMSLSKQLEALKSTLLEKQNAMVKMAEESAETGETFDEAAQETYDNLDAEVAALEGQIERTEKALKFSASNGKAVTEKDGATDKAAANSRNPIVKAVEKPKLEKGIEFARYAMCQVAAKGNAELAANIAKTHYGPDSRIAKTLDFQRTGGKLEGIMKATVEAGTTLDATWAAPLVDYQNYAGDFIEYLRPQTIIGKFGRDGVPALRQIPFNVRIAGQTSGGAAYWVGEGAPKPLTQYDFNDVELRWSKIATIAVLTEELIRFSNPSAERLVRDALAASVIERADIDFVDPAKAAVANVSPASITNGITPIVSSGSTAEAIRCDLQALWAPFIAARNAPRNAVYIMDSSTALAVSLLQNPLGQSEFPGLNMNGGTLMGVPVIVSDYLPVDTDGGMVILANASDIYLADDGQVTIDASREASLQMLDNPTNNSATGTATSMVSMFQTNSVALRAERYINWARRRVSAVSYLTGVNWGSCAVS